MKKQLGLFVLVIISISLFTISCVSTANVKCECSCDCGSCGCSVAVADFSGIPGKDWKLIEARIEDKFRREVLFDRKTLSRENAGSIFILRLSDTAISGTASPNAYTGTYTIGTNQSINIPPLRLTTLTSVFQPEKLRETDYINYLQSAYKWDFINGRLIISSKPEGGREIRLTFAP